MKVLVTGAAGFIGFHVCHRLAATQACAVLGVDNLNAYASIGLKRARLAELAKLDGFRFVQADGAEARVPFREDDDAGRPLSFYAATKKANEAMAYSYAHTHGLNLTGLRFFTVYGPWGRPDMTPMLFARAIRDGTPLRLFNEGRYQRDFTYVDDIVDGVLKVLLFPFAGASGETAAPRWRIFNLGHQQPVEMRRFVQMLEALLGRRANVELLPPLPTEMPATCADLARIHAAVGYEPKVTLEEGLRRFVDWFQHHDEPA